MDQLYGLFIDESFVDCKKDPQELKAGLAHWLTTHPELKAVFIDNEGERLEMITNRGVVVIIRPVSEEEI